MQEIWEIIDGFSLYEVSNLGKVKRKAYTRVTKNGTFSQMREMLMKLQKQPNKDYPAYIAISVTLLGDQGERKTMRVSRLVAAAFVANPNSLPIVNHLDSNPQNNRFDNLEWTTYSGNNEHCKKEGRVRTGALKGMDNPRCRHSLEQVRQAKRLLREQKHSHREIAEITGMTRTAVSEISCGRRWQHVELQNENKIKIVMLLFSYKGGVPESLPSPLAEAPIERLEQLGYSGPFPSPLFDPRTEEAKWTGADWQIIALSEEQIAQREYLRLVMRVDWTGFSEALMGSTAYGKARAAASTSLRTNVDCTELIALLADSRAGRPYVDGINACFASIDAEIDLTEEDKAQLYQLVQNFGLSTIIVVPNYTPPENNIGAAE